jgi:glycosyltransferase involved in cell wall biosynthesis
VARVNRLAIFSPSLQLGLGANVFGKDVANYELFQALVLHGGLDQVDFLMANPAPGDRIAAQLIGAQDGGARIGSGPLLSKSIPLEAGAILRGAARLEDLAWRRRSAADDKAYSLMGLIHTTAPLAIRQEIATSSIAPLHPWDALICTSPSVQHAMGQMFDEWEDYLASRCGGRPPRPQLPLIPLGVNGETFARQAARPDARAQMRQTLGVGPDDVVILWVGRLSFFEKAFPQSMMRAAEEAAQATGVRVHFAMAGWFPDPAGDERKYRQAVAAHAPSIQFHIVDGNDRATLGATWAAADVFISLVDNIQETFGITPLEAMASGLPVVISDWDGYRYTVRDGEEGFLIPTLGGPENSLIENLVEEHVFGLKSYQQYVGIVAQHTAVHVGRATAALTQLIQSPDLRRRMGEAGQKRVRETFDWSVVAPQYATLAVELAAIRQAAPAVQARSRRNPVKGDPFKDFAGFATTTLTLETRLSLPAGMSGADLERCRNVELDMFAASWRGAIDEAGQVMDLLAASGAMTVKAVLLTFPVARRRHLQLSLVWMAKQGLVDWL